MCCCPVIIACYYFNYVLNVIVMVTVDVFESTNTTDDSYLKQKAAPQHARLSLPTTSSAFLNEIPIRNVVFKVYECFIV